jgi:hypothetical protein
VYGFPPRFFAAARDFASSSIIQLQPGQTFTADISIERQKYFDVRVPVRAPEGPFTGVSVSVFAEGKKGPGFELGYSRELQSIVGSLPNGNYTIEATRLGAASATGMTQITVNNSAFSGAPLTLSPNPTIELNIRTDFTAPEARDRPHPQPDQNMQQPAYVSLLPTDEFSSRRGPGHNSQGSPPVIAAVPPGRYWLQVNAPLGYVASISSAGRDLFNSPLLVPYGGSVPPIDITVRNDAGEIEATVSGQPEPARVSQGPAQRIIVQSGATPENTPHVYCISLGNAGTAPLEARTWTNGNPTFRNVPPGDYRVMAFKTAQDFEYHNPAAMRKYESLGQIVHVEAGKKAQVNLQLTTAE